MEADLKPDVEEPSESTSQQGAPGVDTWGGAFVKGDVKTDGGDFIGRDQYKTVITEETAYDVRGLPNPYLGLSAFTYADRASFAGRESGILEAVAKLTAPGSRLTILFITGASGCGKSSFAQAGLLPELEAYYKERRRQVVRAVFRPSSNPLAMLADALGLLGLPELSPQELERFTPEEFARFLGGNTPKDQVNLLVIDQFEEFFTQSAAGARELIFSFLAGLPVFQDIRTHVLVTMRSDFLKELFNHRELWDIAKQGIELRAMTLEELKTAIQQPLWAAQPEEAYRGKRFDPDLLERLTQDTSPDPAYLPLLQTTLQELWNGGSLTLGRYEGLADAIRRRAEAVYTFADFEASRPEQERPPEDRVAILGIFLDLVDVSLSEDPGRDVRRRRVKESLVDSSPQRLRLLDELIQARLLSAGTEISTAGEIETVDIIHESLIANWDRLRDAIAGRRQALQRRSRFEGQLAEWLGSGRSDEYALAGVRLAEARELEGQGDIALRTPEARDLLRCSADLAETAQRRRVRNISLVAVGLSILLLIALVAIGYAFRQTNLLADEKSISDVRRIEAEGANATAQSGEATSEARRIAAEQANSAAEAAESTAVAERDRAEVQAEISLARQLAVQAEELLLSRSDLLVRAALLSTESLQRFPETGAFQAQVGALQILPEPLARMTHEGSVNSVAFSPDGEWVVSGSEDGTARVWEASTGEEVARMTHESTVISVAFRPDGEWVVSGGRDGTARVWKPSTGAEVSRLSHDSEVYSVTFSPDGERVVSVSKDGTARVWHAGSGDEVARLTNDSIFIWSSTAFSPDGKWVVTGGRDGTARVWEAATGEEVARMTYGGPVNSVAFSPDGKWVVSGGCDLIEYATSCTKESARVWDAATGEELARNTHGGVVSSIAFSPDGDLVITGSWDGTARVWEAATGAELARMIHTGVVTTVAFSPDGQRVISGSNDGTARIWQALTGEEVARMTHDGQVVSVAFNPDGERVVSGGRDRTVRVWEAAPGAEVARHNHEDGVSSVAFSPDGERVVSGSNDGTARVWEAATGAEIARMAYEDVVASVAFSPDGERVISRSWDGTVLVWEAATGLELARVTHGGWVISAAFNPDGERVVLGSFDGTVRVWQVASETELTSITHDDGVGSVAFSPDGERVVSGSWDGSARVSVAVSGEEIARMTHDGVVNSVAFSPDGERVVSGSGDGAVWVWEAATGAGLARMTHDGEVNFLAFSPDGGLVVSGSDDGTARVWESATGEELSRMTHEDSVYTVAFSPDGQRVVSGSRDGSARVWEAATGEELARMTHDGAVSSVAFSSDGERVVSGSADGTARVWLWRAGDLIELACARLERNLTLAEWGQYLGDRPYRRTCPNLPPGE